MRCPTSLMNARVAGQIRGKGWHRKQGRSQKGFMEAEDGSVRGVGHTARNAPPSLPLGKS